MLRFLKIMGFASNIEILTYKNFPQSSRNILMRGLAHYQRVLTIHDFSSKFDLCRMKYGYALNKSQILDKKMWLVCKHFISCKFYKD